MRYVPNQDTELQLDRLLNKGLTLDDNFRGGFYEFTTAGGEETVEHNLGHRPVGYILVFADDVVNLHATRVSEWTNNLLYLVSSASSVTVRIFVM